MSTHAPEEKAGFHVAHHFDSADVQFDANRMGIWLFLVTEILLFGGLFCAFAVFRSWYYADFVEAHHHLDKTMGTLFEHLDATVGRGAWVAALSADHGVTPIPEQLTAEGKDSGRLSSRVIGSVVEDKLRAAFGEGRYLAVPFGNDLYFMPGIYDRIRASKPVMDNLLQTLREMPGIARVFRAEELRDPASAQDDIQRAAALSYYPGRSGDMILVPKPGWMFSAAGTTHGSASPDDQRVPLMFLGAGVRAGKYDDAATPADLVPTLAAICSVRLGKVDGHVLTAALAH